MVSIKRPDQTLGMEDHNTVQLTWDKAILSSEVDRLKNIQLHIHPAFIQCLLCGNVSFSTAHVGSRKMIE